MPMNPFYKLSLFSLPVLAASSAYSAGFALNDHSATASGTALAGAASSNADISFSYWNPALFLNTTKTTFYLSGALVSPSSDITVSSARDSAGNDLTVNSSVSSDNPVENELVPALYFARPLSDKTVAGVSFNVPYGLSGDYGDDWAGRFHATETSIEDRAFSFSLAHRANKKLSLGASVQLHEAEVVLASKVGVASAPSVEGNGFISADATAVGYSLGALFEPVKGTRIGIGYRSEVDFDFKGDVNYTNVANINALSSLTPGYDLVNTGVSDSLTFPSLLTLSFDQILTKHLTLNATAMQTNWDSVDELRIDFDSAQPDSVLTFKFESQWFYSTGFTYHYSDQWTLRTGVAVDYSPVVNESRSVRTPDGDRTWLSAGGTYDLNDMTSLTFAYTYVMVDNVSISRDGTGEDASRGALEADYQSSANVFSAALNMTF